MLHPSNKEKKKKEKEILNNNLAILPSHDTYLFLIHYLYNYYMVCALFSHGYHVTPFM